MPEDAEPEYSDWQSFERIFSNGKLKNATSRNNIWSAVAVRATGR